MGLSDVKDGSVASQLWGSLRTKKLLDEIFSREVSEM
jgi:hypothetical protein